MIVPCIPKALQNARIAEGPFEQRCCESPRICTASLLRGAQNGLSFNDPHHAIPPHFLDGRVSLESVFVTGSTVSADFPVQKEANSPFANAQQDPHPDNSKQAAFITAFRQDQGEVHWSTVHPRDPIDTWLSDGLAVDVDEDGIVAWGGRLSEVPLDPQFWTYDYVTPAGAFTKGVGGGFFILFDEDYHIEWNTPYGSIAAFSGITDLRLVEDVHYRYAYITGITLSTTDPTLWPLDVVDLTGTADYFQGTGGGGRDAYVARFRLHDYQNQWCTYWGGAGSDLGLALEVGSLGSGGQIWVGGTTQSNDLDTDHLPSSGAGSLHQTTYGGNTDGFLLKFSFATNGLLHGTLYGGPGADGVFDLGANPACSGGAGCIMYATGETSSTSDMLYAGSGTLCDQPLLGTTGSNYRDAYILALDANDQSPIWTTYWGGEHYDRGWGIACTDDELFLVGGAISDQITYPLKEWDQLSVLDWYDDDLSNNIGGGLGALSWYNNTFQHPLDQVVFDPVLNRSHDAFICSFGVGPNLGVIDGGDSEQLLQLVPAGEGLWALILSDDGAVRVEIVDVHGTLVSSEYAVRKGHLVDLRAASSGLYMVRVTDRTGGVGHAKLHNP